MAPIISVTLPNDGDNAIAANIDDPINAILAVVNGNLDDSNIASMNGSKILAGTLPNTAFDTTNNKGWTALSAAPNTVAAAGNRSYTCTFNGLDLTGILSVGDALKFTRTVTAPTQSTSLNGSTQYYNKTSPNKLSFTDTFSCMAWIKITSYGASTIISRFNGTSGWQFSLTGTGQLRMRGFNGGASNTRDILSYQAVPLNKWVHVFASFQMSDHTSATCKVMMDGVDVGGTINSGGTAPTALIQAGNLEVGSYNSGNEFFPGKIAQVAVFSAVISEATAITYMSQTLAGSETNLASAYSFNNSIADLNTSTPNDLTAQGSAAATNADTPFTSPVTNTSITAGTTNYGKITAISFSTNTTMTVKASETDVLPTSGGLSAAYYSLYKYPYGVPVGDVDRTDNLYIPYKFYAYLTTTANLSGSNTKLPFDTKLYDTGNNFDVVTNSRFTAPVGGYWFFNAAAYINALADQAVATIMLYKNGVIYADVVCNNSGANDNSMQITQIIPLLASDYIEIFVNNSQGTRNWLGYTAGGGHQLTYFQGYLLSLY